LIAGALIFLLIFVILILFMVCVKRQAKISSLKKEVAFLQASLKVLTEKSKESKRMNSLEEGKEEKEDAGIGR